MSKAILEEISRRNIREETSGELLKTSNEKLLYTRIRGFISYFSR
jgi:hypothetical protein